MILDFKDNDTRSVFSRERVGKFSNALQLQAQRRLMMLNNATNLSDLQIPHGNRLEKLSGDRAEQHSIRINDQWRVCFVWNAGNAPQVEIVDYH